VIGFCEQPNEPKGFKRGVGICSPADGLLVSWSWWMLSSQVVTAASMKLIAFWDTARVVS
jgi:hypothetical protein